MDPSLNAAIERFSAIGADDPRLVPWGGKDMPHQLAEAACLLEYIQRLDPTPTIALQLAAHCQHLRRFAYPRSEFAEGRTGYLLWRKQAARRSSDEAASILRAEGISEMVIAQVIRIVNKRDRAEHPDVQTMEDALCLAFFRLDALDFASKHDRDAVVKILRRTWGKLSAAAKTLALSEPYPDPLRQLLAQIAAVA